GTYPFVTSADCSLNGLARNAGVEKSDLAFTLAVTKAPYMTRVGHGPFTTELGGVASDDWCNNPVVNRAFEEEKFPDRSINSEDDFYQGIAIRRAGGEFGTTTQRPRRVGWLDLPLLRYAARFTGRDLILTKVDVLDECEVIKICSSHRYDGPDYRVGERTLKSGDIFQVAIPDPEVLNHCRPIYHEMPGWLCSTRGITCKADLPEKLVAIIRFIEREADVSVKAVSLGPGRSEVVVM
ncbi:MAG: adenylosuccinate synthetase, partial [Candidatus Liptonbacteria bacterium]|nr:adenylosuccinate synthetase [Candidatus Liptonbacteria bacterium]